MDEQSIFLQALDRPTDEQAAWLDEVCGADTLLRQRIETLLERHEQASRFLEQPAVEIADTEFRDSSEAPQQSTNAEPASLIDTQIVDNTNHSVLDEIARTVDVPHVILRESTTTGAGVSTEHTDGRYVLHGEIARGGMGAILKGRDTDLGRELAIKVLLDSHKQRPEVIRRFIEEAQIGGQLQHPGIAPVYELGRLTDDRPFFSMKLVQGETLSVLLKERQGLTEDRAKFVGIFEQICQTVAYAHSRGVIHRDLKPDNIMVGAFGEVQVMDWGLAKVLNDRGMSDEKDSDNQQQGADAIQTRRLDGGDRAELHGSQTQMGSIMGTPAYMPPEQALGKINQLDERTDVFGLGAILCQILTGKPPYIGENATAVFQLARHGKLEECHARLSTSGADVELITLSRNCLEVDAEDRPRDAAVLTDRVTSYLESVETKLRATEMERAAQAARVEEERKRQRVTLALATSVLLLITLAGGGFLWLQQQQNRRRIAATNKVHEALSTAKLHQGLADADDLQVRLRELDKAVNSAKSAVKFAEDGDIASDLRQDAEQQLATLKARTATVQQQAAQTKACRELQKQLDLIRLSQAKSARDFNSDDDHFFDVGSADKRYQQAFGKAGLDLNVVDVASAAAWVKNSPISERIIAALDDWGRSTSVKLTKGPDSQSNSNRFLPAMLRAVADAADTSPWRRELRAALFANDSAKLKQLATNEDARRASPELIGWLGFALRSAGEFETAIQVLRRAQRNHPGDFWLNYEIGESLGRSGHTAAGTGFIRAALAILPDSSGAMFTMGEALRVGGDLDGALHAYELVCRREPNDYAAHMVVAWIHVARKDFKAAVAASRSTIAVAPDKPGGYRELSNALHGLNKNDEAIAALRKAIEVDSNPQTLAGSYNNLGNRLNDQGKLKEAMAAYQKACKVDPTYAMAHYNIGEQLKDQKKLDNAIVEYRKAIQLAPDYALAYRAVADALADGGSPKESIIEYHRALKLDPKNAETHNNFGRALQLLGKLVEAKQAYRRAIELDRKHKKAYNNLGVALAAQNMLKQAVAQYRKALEIDSQYSSAHSNLGVALARQGQLKTAAKHFQKSVDLEPTKLDLRFNLARALMMLGKADAAAAALKKVVDLDPANVEAHYKLGSVLKLQGKRAEAIAAWNKCGQLAPRNPLVKSDLAWLLVFPVDTPAKDAQRAAKLAQQACEIAPKEGPFWKTLALARYRNAKWRQAIQAAEKSVELGRSEPANLLLLAMSHSQLKDKDKARMWYDKALAWRKQKKPDKELLALYAEAAKLLAEPSKKNEKKKENRR